MEQECVLVEGESNPKIIVKNEWNHKSCESIECSQGFACKICKGVARQKLGLQKSNLKHFLCKITHEIEIDNLEQLPKSVMLEKTREITTSKWQNVNKLW